MSASGLQPLSFWGTEQLAQTCPFLPLSARSSSIRCRIVPALFLDRTPELFGRAYCEVTGQQPAGREVVGRHHLGTSSWPRRYRALPGSALPIRTR